jgi:hypothetical protein
MTVPALADEQLSQAAPAPSPSPSATPAPPPLTTSGYIDAGYDAAANQYISGPLNRRVFDNVAGTPQLQTINLTAAYAGANLGGKVELNFGEDADIIHSYPQALYVCRSGPSAPGPGVIFGQSCNPPFNPQLDLTQAYLSYTAGKFTLEGGKFETLAGAEVIESPSDLNFSRSILFGYAVPFTHTGARLTYAMTSKISLIAGVNRGWDTTRPLSTSDLRPYGVPPGTPPDSDSLTGEFGAAWNPSSAFSLTAQGYTGKPENWIVEGCFLPTAGGALVNTGCNRSLVDVVGTYHVTSALTATVNFDGAQQTKTPSPAFVFGAPLTLGTVTWNGIAGYVSEAFNPTVTGTLRYESFNDAQGYRIGNGVGTHWSEGTATAQFTLPPHVILRAELRMDTASQPIFAFTPSPQHPTGMQSYLTTYGLEAIVHVPSPR